MANMNFVMLYVADAAHSAEFYSTIFGKKPEQASPGFAMFALANGLKVGLWKQDTVEPPVSGAKPGTEELGFAEESDADVGERFAEWTGNGVVVAQNPTRMSFGYTFTALDPDGHRLRVYKLAA